MRLVCGFSAPSKGSAILIAIEGIDGSGKTLQAQLLHAQAQRAGLRAAVLKFPRYGQTTFSASITQYLNGRFGPADTASPRLAALLFAGDRLESLDEIEQLRRHNDVLIIDRYVASNLAYQGAKLPPAQRDEIFDWICRIEFEAHELPPPDLNILLQMPVDLASKLIAQRPKRTYTDKSADLHEADLPYLENCFAIYDQLAESERCGRWARIPCTGAAGQLRPSDQISQAIWDLVSPAEVK